MQHDPDYMTTYQNAKALTGLTLGKATDYASQYDPLLLQAVPRSLNRDELDLKNGALPFKGEDVWYGYELSWLNSKGKPVVAVAEFRVSCESENIIESKSFKLYLNSFNQTKFADTNEVQQALSKDLSATAGLPVEVVLSDVEQFAPLAINHDSAECIDDLDISVTSYEFSTDWLNNVCSKEKSQERLVSHLLKSNCLITNQPDWATVYIEYKGGKINREKLLQYLISFRQHNEFHEQCVERIFCDLMKFGQFDELTVFARYTRRGGLDINPYRSTSHTKAPNTRTLRQ